MSGHCPKCGDYTEEDESRLCSGCASKPETKPMSTIDELRGLVERATKLPWSFRIFGEGDKRAFDIQGQAGEPCVINWQGFDDSGRTMDGHQDNGDLIVAAVNALPALLDERDRLLAVAEAARRVVQHTADFDLESALARLDGEVG